MQKILFQNEEDYCIKINSKTQTPATLLHLKKNNICNIFLLLVLMKPGPNSATFPAVPSRLARTFKFHSPELIALVASPSTTPMRRVQHPQKVNVTEI
jgi:hypothetical protein